MSSFEVKLSKIDESDVVKEWAMAKIDFMSQDI